MAGLPVYLGLDLDLDLDVLDLAYAPGISTPDRDGLTTRELAGFRPFGGDGELYDSAVILDRGQHMAVYGKAHL